MANSQDQFNYGPALPDNIDQKSGEFEGPIQTNTATASAEALVDTATGMFTSAADYIRSKAPSQMMSANEFKNSQYYYPGSTVAGKSEAQASVDFQRHTSKTMHNAIMSGAPQNLTTTLATNGASMIGFMLNPVNDLAFTGAGMMVGVGSTALLGALEESDMGYKAYKALATTTNVAGGAAVGALGLAPDVGARYYADKALDQNPDGISALVTLGWGAGLGGLVGGVLGRKKIVAEESFNVARETAVDQLANGKTVEVGPIVQDGYRRARAQEQRERTGEEIKRDAQPKPDIANDPNSDPSLAAAKERETKTLELKKQNAKLKSDYELAKELEKKQKGKVKETPAQIEAWERARNEIFDDIHEKRMKGIRKRWESGEQLSDLEAYWMSEDLGKKRMSGELEEGSHPDDLRPSDRESMKYEKLRNREEPEARQRYEELKDQMEKEKAETDIKDIKARWDDGKHLSEREKYEFLRNKSKMLEKKLEANKDAIADIEAEKAMEKNPGIPVNRSDLNNTANKVSSPEGDLSYDPLMEEELDRMMDKIPDVSDDPTNEHSERIKRMEKEGLLSAEQKAALEKANEANEKGKTLEKYIKRMADCLKQHG